MRTKRPDLEFDYQETGFDGTNVYTLANISKWVEARKQKNLTVGSELGIAEVVKGDVPHITPEVERVLWLAYLSGCYFDKSGWGRYEPIVTHSSPKAYIYGYQQPVWVDLSASRFRFVQTAVFMDEGTYERWASEDVGYLAAPPEKHHWNAPYNAGFTNSILTTELFSKSGETDFPQKTTFIVLAPIPGARTNKDLSLTTRYTLEVNTFTPTCELNDFKPVLPGKTRVSDWRFERDQTRIFNVRYETATGWLSSEAILAQAGFQKAIQPQESQKHSLQLQTTPTTARSAFTMKMLLLSLSILFGVIVLATTYKQKKTNNERN